MRRFIMVTLVIAAFAVVSTAGTANASTRWPARCSNFKCVNAHLNAVHTSLKKFEANVNGFFNCLDAFPITEYSNFLSDDGTTSRTGLDVTASGDSIQGWALDIDGGTCGFPESPRWPGGVIHQRHVLSASVWCFTARQHPAAVAGAPPLSARPHGGVVER